MEFLQEIEGLLFHSNIQVKEDRDNYKTSEKTLEGELDIRNDQQEELDLRYQEYLTGNGKSYSWEKVKEHIQNKHGF